MNIKIFNPEKIDLGNGNYLHLINIEKIDKRISNFIDERIVNICEGYSDTDLPTIKKKLVSFLESKEDSNIVMGAIAEFFSHLYLNSIGFKQEFLFLNLEERSIKKGFDGYYSYLNEEWIFESKSGKIYTKKISHDSKINEAYKDLQAKIAGKSKNNPWNNAYNHACHIDIKCMKEIRNNLKKLSNDYINKKYEKICNFNIIPGSTIFIERLWNTIDMNEIEIEIRKVFSKLDFKKINILCINKNSIKSFFDYLKR